MIKPGLEMKDW